MIRRHPGMALVAMFLALAATFAPFNARAAALDQLAQRLDDLQPVRTADALQLTFGGGVFAFDSVRVEPEAYHALNALAAFLRDHEQYTVTITGHTDSVGNASYNQRLSRARAEAIAGVLERRGVAGRRMTTYGKGEANPVASNETPEGRARNRRVIVTILYAPANVSTNLKQ